MKNKKIIIGIVCGVVLIGIIALVALLLGTNKKEEPAKEKENIKLNETRTFEGYEFKNAKMKQLENEKYSIDVTITNKSAKEEPTRIVILYYGADEKELGGAVCMIPKLEKNKTIDFNCACEVKEILNAVDYKVIATDKEISELKQS